MLVLVFAASLFHIHELILALSFILFRDEHLALGNWSFKAGAERIFLFLDVQPV